MMLFDDEDDRYDYDYDEYENNDTIDRFDEAVENMYEYDEGYNNWDDN